MAPRTLTAITRSQASGVARSRPPRGADADVVDDAVEAAELVLPPPATIASTPDGSATSAATAVAAPPSAAIRRHGLLGALGVPVGGDDRARPPGRRASPIARPLPIGGSSSPSHLPGADDEDRAARSAGPAPAPLPADGGGQPHRPLVGRDALARS